MAGRGEFGSRESFMIWRNAMLMVILILICRGVFAQQGNQPSMEFLEFLGEWENEQGEWLDPVEYVDEQEEKEEAPYSVREEQQEYEN